MKRILSILCVLMMILVSCNGESANINQTTNTTNASNETHISTNQSTEEQVISSKNQTILPTEKLPIELKQLIDSNRKAVFKPVDRLSVSKIVNGYQTTGLDPETDAKIAEMLKQAKNEYGDIINPEALTHEQILQELDYLFDLLKYGYAAYTYFGGDEVFSALKQLMQAKLSTMNDPLSSDAYMNELLVPYLRSVIIDNHFSISSADSYASIGKTKIFYSCEDIFFNKDGEDYITNMDGKEYRLADDKAKTYMLPTLDRDGKLAWIIGMMNVSNGISIKSLRVNFEDVQTKEIISKQMYLTAESFDYFKDLSSDVYTISDENNIPILTNRALQSNNKSGEDQLSAFVDTGKTLRDKNLLILDLRRNGGGNSGYAYKWLINYTNTIYAPRYPFFNTQLFTNTSMEIYNEGMNSKPINFWSDVSYENPKQLTNANLVFVLTDNQIGSSGETFIGYLRQMDNVIFVGVPTLGCLTTGNIGSNILPESKLYIRLGVQLNILPDLSQFEGEGFAPDLWVPPGESLERTIKFIEQYGLN